MKIVKSEIPATGLPLDFGEGRRLSPETLDRHCGERYPKVEPVVTGSLLLMPSSGDLILSGWVEGTLHLQCARCLQEFDLDTKLDLHLLLKPMAENDPTAWYYEAAEDGSTIGVDPETIDLGEIVVQELLLAAPMKPLCSEECRGLCPSCGLPAGSEACSCHPDESVDPRWAALLELKRTLTR